MLTALRAAGIDARILDVGGRGSTAENAERLALDITASADDARPFVIVAYSRGLPDVLELLVTRPAAAARVAAVVSVAGASNGSPLADRFRAAYDLLVARFPLPGCGPGTGRSSTTFVAMSASSGGVGTRRRFGADLHACDRAPA
jgi:hypothetical protein